ncbi:MAG: hypothetical protein QM791_17635 [Ferruginibacter sp.]
MKKVFFLGAAIFCSQVIFAQDFPQAKDTTSPSTAMDSTKKWDKSMDWFITVQGGEVIVVKGDKTKKLEKEKTLQNGSVITSDGNVKAADGTTTQLKEGDKVYADGSIVKGNNKDQQQ